MMNNCAEHCGRCSWPQVARPVIPGSQRIPFQKPGEMDCSVIVEFHNLQGTFYRFQIFENYELGVIILAESGTKNAKINLFW